VRTKRSSLEIRERPDEHSSSRVEVFVVRRAPEVRRVQERGPITRRDFSPPEKRADRLVHVVARKLEGAKERAQRPLVSSGEVVLHLLEQRRRIEQIERLLRE